MKTIFSHRNVASGIAVFSLVATFLGGMWYGKMHIPAIDHVTNVANKENTVAPGADFEPFWKVWNILNEKYVSSATTSEVAVADQAKVWGAIEGLAHSLSDPYTVFLPPVESEMFESEIRGNFEGVGMEVGIKDDVLTVISPLKGNPAARAGVRAGDKIVKIDDRITQDLTVDEAIKFIRGEKGTAVRLTLFREGVQEPFELKIIRDVINIPTVDTELRKDGIFYIALHNFSAVSHSLFRDALREFVLAKTDKMIIDLRGNPGGYLEAAVDMASWFLPVGKPVVIEEFGKSRERKIYPSKGYNIFTDKLKLVILIDNGSASASEILAGALHEYGKATLVGNRTFGKGSVQELIEITPETDLKVTIARWLTPNGNSISENGVAPDIEVKLTLEDIEAKRDRQLAAAVEELLGN